MGKGTRVIAQKQIQAQQGVADAKGDADSAIEPARGNAEANRVRAASIKAALINCLQTTKWDGMLPQFTGGAIPFFNIQATPEGIMTP